MTRGLLGALGVAVIASAVGAGGVVRAVGARQTPQPNPAGGQVTEAALNQAIDQLGAFDLKVRTQASRTVRRAPEAMAVSALGKAARSHKDSYVRYRALVLLTGFGEAAAPVSRDLLGDPDNRVRVVAYAWFGAHPDPTVLQTLLSALDTERSEFVRPVLTRVVAAYGDDPRARAALLPLITRGEDLFRGAVIEALGDYRARYAAGPIGEVAKLDGPLQDEAVIALGKMGEAATLPVLSGLQKNGPDEVQPSVAAAVCLITSSCTVQEEYLKKTLAFAGASENLPALLSRVSHALGALGGATRPPALAILFDAGVPAKDPARSVIAVSLGTVAMRNPTNMISALEARSDLPAALLLLRDAFDMLSEEDFGQERFYVAVRQALTSSAAGSKRRQVATAIIDTLEF
jgi:HEAT repeat protein